jgi:hypothetical protein
MGAKDPLDVQPGIIALRSHDDSTESVHVAISPPEPTL